MEVKVTVSEPAQTPAHAPVVPDFPDLDDAALAALQERVDREVRRRQTLKSAVEQIDRATREYLTASGRGPGEPWVRPSGVHDAYPRDWEVEHNGTRWVSLVPANVHEPGISGWRQVADATDPAAGDAAPWVQPAGAHDAYNTGDLVAFDGKTYRSLVDDNVWSPAAYPAAWQEVTA